MKDGSPFGPLHAGAPSHRKVYDLAELLGIEHPHAFGLLCCLWARALVEASDGIVRGGAHRVAALTGWNGDPHKVLEALVAVGVIDRVGDRFVLHDWMEYGGRSLKEAGTKRANMAKARASRHDRQCIDAYGVESTALGSMPLSSPLSSSSSSSSGSEEIATHVPTQEQHVVPIRPQLVGRTPRAQTIAGILEADTCPSTPAEVLKDPHYGKILREKFGFLTGQGSTPTLLGEVTARFDNFTRKHRTGGRDAAFNALIGWLGRDCGVYEARQRRERKETGALDVDAIAYGNRKRDSS